MKKSIAIVSGILVLVLLIAGGVAWGLHQEQKRADQKWLATVEKLVKSGQNRISTTEQRQVTLLKQWAKSRGFGVSVSHLGKDYRVDLMKPIFGTAAPKPMVAVAKKAAR